jgi:hypothetical protein
MPYKFRQCAVDGCERKSRCRGWCNMHHQRWMTHGDPLVVKESPRGPSHGRWKGDDAGYAAIHLRLKTSRTLTACAVCGASATQWAYDHADPDEQYDKTGKYLVAYSTDPSHYFPVCASCHKRFDLRVRSNRLLHTAL